MAPKREAPRQRRIGSSWIKVVPFQWRSIVSKLGALTDQAGFKDLRVRPAERLAVARMNRNEATILSPPPAAEMQFIAKWSPAGTDSTSVEIVVRNDPKNLATELGVELVRLLKTTRADSPEMLVAPGEPFLGRMAGSFRDYSVCATAESVTDLREGKLGLGRWAFSMEPNKTLHGDRLFLSRFENNEKMEFSGILLCAPTGSGKTELIARWAREANEAGYCVLIVDVKGNMKSKLATLSGDRFRLTTKAAPSDRINFLRSLTARTSVGSRQIREFAELLLPDAGWLGVGGQDEMRYQQRLAYLVAFIHILKLVELFYPSAFSKGTRKADLSDLYRFVFNEKAIATWIDRIEKGEKSALEKGKRMPAESVTHWAGVLGPALDPTITKFGQRRDPTIAYIDHVRGILLALDAFSSHGTLRDKVRDDGSGKLFSLSDLQRDETQAPTTILLETREQDGSAAWTILALALKAVQPLLFDRWNQPPEKRARMRPILLLLDESRRIRGLQADELITVAREANVGCVLVYQNLDQIESQFGDAGLHTILENVGTQVYLNSLKGNTASHLIKFLSERYRQIETVNEADGSVQYRIEPVPFFTKRELFKLPAGKYPGLVVIPRRQDPSPILVDFDHEHS